MFRKHFSSLLFIVYSLLGLAFLSWSADNAVQSLRHTVRYLMSPWSDPPLALMEQMGDTGRNLARLIAQDRVARSLEERGLTRTMDRLWCEAVEAENVRLRTLTGLTPLPRYRPLPARVWSWETAAALRSVTIHRGARDGIKATDPVVAFVGDRPAVVGLVAEVFPDTARVMLLTDPSSAVSAAVSRTGEQGVVEGEGPSRLVLNYLYSDTAAAPGDEVLTAGLGELFPSGLLLGTVVGLEDQGIESFRRAVVKPAVRATGVREVLVLLREARVPEKRP